MNPFLSICMIVKDEEKVLRRCLESIKGIADEIIIVDTGSIDKTKEIALEYTNMVFDFEWIDDFSKARNFAASKATGEWILAIDADEYVDRDQFLEFKQNLRENPPANNILAVQIVNFVGSNGKDTSLNYHERIYKNDGTIIYYRSIHELLMHRDSKENRGFSDLQIYHSGYMEDVTKEKRKSDRNLSLLLNKKEKEPIDYYFIGNEYDQMGDVDKAIKYYQKGFKLKGDFHRDWVKKLLLRLVNTLHKAKRSKESLEIIESCEGIYPHLVDFKFYKGIIYFEQGDFKKSKKVFEEILVQRNQLQADSSTDFLEFLPHKYLGEICENENDLHAAVRHYTGALSINDADDYIWMRLINLLAKHSTLEELSEFLNNNFLTKPNITPQRVIKLLLSVPNINVQKLTRSFLEEDRLSKIESEALLLKNLQLDGSLDEIVQIINEKTHQEVISLLSTGIFSLIDFIILTIEMENEKYQDIICSINFDQPLDSILNMLFSNKNKKLSSFEEDLFVSIVRQIYVLQYETSKNVLNRKKIYISIGNRKKINMMELGKLL